MDHAEVFIHQSFSTEELNPFISQSVLTVAAVPTEVQEITLSIVVLDEFCTDQSSSLWMAPLTSRVSHTIQLGVIHKPGKCTQSHCPCC